MTKKSKKDNKNVSEDVMNKINSDEVSMKPEWHFHALSFLLGFSVFITSALSALFINLTIVSVRDRELLELREFGRPGTILLFQQIPWLLVLALVMTVTLAVVLLKHYEISHKHRLYAVMGVLVVIVISISGVFALIDIDDSAQNFGPLRGAGRFGNELEDRRIGGVVTEINEDNIVIKDRSRNEVTVDVSSIDPKRIDDVEVGDNVGFLGEADGNEEFTAERVRKGKHPRPMPTQRPLQR